MELRKVRREHTFLMQFLCGIGALPVLLIDRYSSLGRKRIDRRLQAGKRPLHGITMIAVQLLLSLGEMLLGNLDFCLGAHRTIVSRRAATVIDANMIGAWQ